MLNILIFDIENSPNISANWGIWEQNAVWVEKEWQLLSFAYKWYGDKSVKVRTLHDTGSKVDKQLTRELWMLFDKADIIIAHNGDKFDIRKANARFLLHGLPPPSPYRTIDTLKVARSRFALNSNRLDDIAKALGIGMKESTGGAQLWRDCMAGDEQAWAKMKKYNKQDVVLLEAVYEELRPWIKNPINLGVVCEGKVCPHCASTKIQKRGMGYSQSGSHQRYMCSDCAGWSKGKTISSKLVIKP
jgi:predicted RecB family nuclease